jgi:hypothetical protein
MRLSQSHLSLLETCPRKFQYVHLDQLMAPVSPEEQSRREWGTQFHLVMQQRELGLSPPSSLPPSPAFQAAADALITQLPHVFHPDQAANRFSEHRRILEVSSRDGQVFLLSAVYDLLFFEGDRATIFDWKTYQKPRKSTWLAQSWQSRLYPFILVETTELEPNQVAMEYWFIKAGEGGAIAPESARFPYTADQHKQTGQDLMNLLDTLSQRITQYEQSAPMPKIPESLGRCQDCPFNVLCGRYSSRANGSPSQSTETEAPNLEALLDIENIAEVPLQN